ncbi:hypothetical protein G7054_g10822 [Neopestalotiopsis clavispora]|nr:hypothetical protein G7054_g10822 [Neopestalotiopsis clavispora]
MIKSALDHPRIGGSRLDRNFRRLLKDYSQDLRQIAVSEAEHQAAKFVGRNAKYIAENARREMSSASSNRLAGIAGNDNDLEFRRDRKARINDFLQSLPIPQTQRLDSLPLDQQNFSSDIPVVDDHESSDDSDGASDGSEHMQPEESSFPAILKVEHFLKGGKPMVNLRDRMYNFVNFSIDKPSSTTNPRKQIVDSPTSDESQPVATGVEIIGET